MHNNKDIITGDMQVEELMEKFPESVTYFILNKVSPISCAGPYPTTLRQMLTAKKVPEIDKFIDGLNQYLNKQQEP